MRAALVHSSEVHHLPSPSGQLRACGLRVAWGLSPATATGDPVSGESPGDGKAGCLEGPAQGIALLEWDARPRVVQSHSRDLDLLKAILPRATISPDAS